MFRIAKNLVRTLEQSVSESLQWAPQDTVDVFFQAVPPNLLAPQLESLGRGGGGADAQQHVNASLSGLRCVYVDDECRPQCGLHSFFDYIVGVDDDPVPMVGNQHGYLYPDYEQVTALLNGHAAEGTTLKLNVWSAKGGQFRDVYVDLQPRDADSMDDVPVSDDPGVADTRQHATFRPLGVKVQWTPLIAATFTYHILALNIASGPAQLAGLVPDEDYIVGCQDGLLATGGPQLLADIVRSRAGQQLTLYVYNKVSDSTRPVVANIGPDGRLGCNIGYGFLHRIPAVPGSGGATDPTTIAAPPLSEEAFIPSAVAATTTTAPPPSSRKKKLPRDKDSTMLDYFNEGKDPHTHTRAPPADQQPPPPTTST
ncbi:Grh1p KNAG_0F00220 [Huiozyma naganishii CBS 8797]|uniref:PDZ GRASP-type domain-containing protein n=1 Tax=Huiozyma naganishii (strain ATCC MYA-139 / BCRC 22969 / CBS 8797 / KCTC 17520 / NBRC 10181 / NCYC 3082 / Yp74L-3) TaxID=1071383 RepID=J7S703_HUIN7|nr:hypothetical protein KNAG_0F00220 [Kazachstania naganishii CBS 8797]CCK70694.1 hypothetical protein KNAG_0F00220 [Kazachstania naganishii CBS 8797]